MSLILTKNHGIDIKDVDTRQGIVMGYLSTFGILDHDGDIVQKGAFSKTIQERGPAGNKQIKYLQDHDRFKTVGVFQVLKEDDIGLYYEGKVGRHTTGQDFLKMVEDKIITQHSIGYRAIKQERTSEGNIIKEMYLAEGSGLQVDAANPFTPIVGIKSTADIIMMFDALEKALTYGTYSDDCFKETIIPRYESLKSILPQLSTEPHVDIKTILQNFKF